MSGSVSLQKRISFEFALADRSLSSEQARPSATRSNRNPLTFDKTTLNGLLAGKNGRPVLFIFPS